MFAMLLLIIASIFIIPAQPMNVPDMPDVDFKHCKNPANHKECLKEAMEETGGGIYDMQEMLIWSGIGTRGGTNRDLGGGTDELLIGVHHMIHTIPAGMEKSQSTTGKQNVQAAVEYKLVSALYYWNNPGELKKLGVGLLDDWNILHVNNPMPNDEDNDWDVENNNDDGNEKFGACSSSSDASVQMCTWAKVTASGAAENGEKLDDGQPRRVVKICTSIYRVLAKGGRQRFLPVLGCVVLDDICTMEDPGCWSPLGAAATFNPKNAKIQEAGKREL